jgi:hypothetical protein
LRASIAQWRDIVLDREIVVDDCRRTLDRDVDAFRVAVRERDRAAIHLAHLIDLDDEIACVAETFGPEIADQHAATLLADQAGGR